MAVGTVVGEARRAPAAAAPDRPAAERDAQVAVLTGLRGLAALSVVLIHSSAATDHPGFGIQVFGPVSLFVLSGFLLFRPWSAWGLGLGVRPSVRTFARRRLARVLPAYLVMLLVVAAVYAPSRPDGAGGWLRGLTLSGIYVADGLRPGLQQTWSLCTELSWYAVLPVMGLAAVSLSRRASTRTGAFWWVVGGCALSVPVTAGWRWWFHVEDLTPRVTFSFWLPGFLLCFAAGALVAHVLAGERAGVVDLRPLRAVVARTWPVLLVVVVAAAVNLSPLARADGAGPATFTERQIRFGCALVLAVTLLVAAAVGREGSPLGRLLAAPWLVAAGRWSYGIYLWHLVVVVVVADVLSRPSGVLGVLVLVTAVLAISIPLGAASWAWVERPAIAWARRGSAGRPRPWAGVGVRVGLGVSEEPRPTPFAPSQPR